MHDMKSPLFIGLSHFQSTSFCFFLNKRIDLNLVLVFDCTLFVTKGAIVKMKWTRQRWRLQSHMCKFDCVRKRIETFFSAWDSVNLKIIFFLLTRWVRLTQSRRLWLRKSACLCLLPVRTPNLYCSEVAFRLSFKSTASAVQHVNQHDNSSFGIAVIWLAFNVIRSALMFRLHFNDKWHPSSMQQQKNETNLIEISYTNWNFVIKLNAYESDSTWQKFKLDPSGGSTYRKLDAHSITLLNAKCAIVNDVFLCLRDAVLFLCIAFVILRFFSHPIRNGKCMKSATTHRRRCTQTVFGDKNDIWNLI